MLCTIICYDKPDHVDLRMKTRPDHLKWIEGCKVTFTYVGPLLADDGQTPKGSLLIGDFESLEAARTFAKADPYARAGLFDAVSIHPTRKVFPAG
jgi:uncharacterized protein YciI